MRGGFAARSHARRRQAARTGCSRAIAGFDARRQRAQHDDAFVRAGHAAARGQRRSPDAFARGLPAALPGARRPAGSRRRTTRSPARVGRPGRAASRAGARRWRRCGHARASGRAVRGAGVKAPAIEGLAGRRQAQREHVPADRLGAGGEFELHAVLGQAAAVGDGLQRQPFEPRAVGDAQPRTLRGGLRRCCGRSASRPAW